LDADEEHPNKQHRCRKIKTLLVILLFLILYFSFCLWYSEVRVPAIGYCVGASEEQEKFFEYTLGNLFRPLGININADYVHTGYIEYKPYGFRQNASHLMLRVTIDFWGKGATFYWEATKLKPTSNNYLNKWDYYHISTGDYYNGKPSPCDPFYGYGDTRKPMLIF